MPTHTGCIVPREVTDQEAQFFREHGWARLDQLISSYDAGALLARAQEVMGIDASTTRKDGREGGKSPQMPFNMWGPMSVGHLTGESVDPTFYGFSHSVEIGRAYAKLDGSSVRYNTDAVAVKMPSGLSETGANPTRWHSDDSGPPSSIFDSLETGRMMFWVALADVSYPQGTMRFIGRREQTDEVLDILTKYEHDPVASYPILEEMGVLSPPMDLKAGDATIHTCGTYHSAPPNSTRTPRWGYLHSVFRAHARFVAGDVVSNGVAGINGLVVGEEFPDYRFPVLA